MWMLRGFSVVTDELLVELPLREQDDERLADTAGERFAVGVSNPVSFALAARLVDDLDKRGEVEWVVDLDADDRTAGAVR